VKYLNNLAVCYMWQGKYAAADRILTRALSILSGIQSPDPLLIADIYNNLGLIYHHAFGVLPKAEEYYVESLAIKEQA
jgi:tetratricopeptide (TPR) repeat protein